MAQTLARIILNSCYTLKQVIKAINAYATPEAIAGLFAWDAAEESGFTDSDTIESHLDFLAEKGAIFDHLKALKEALKAKQADLNSI